MSCKAVHDLAAAISSSSFHAPLFPLTRLQPYQPSISTSTQQSLSCVTTFPQVIHPAATETRKVQLIGQTWPTAFFFSNKVLLEHCHGHGLGTVNSHIHPLTPELISCSRKQIACKRWKYLLFVTLQNVCGSLFWRVHLPCSL